MDFLKRIISYMFFYSGLVYLLKFLFCVIQDRNGLIVILYHRVIENNGIEGSMSEMVVSPQMFDSQMKYLASHYHIININDYLSSSKALSFRFFKPRLLITFDDGWRDNYDNAYPVLKRYGLPALIFLTTGYIGTGKVFWPERIARVLEYILREAKDNNAVETAEAVINKRLREFQDSDDGLSLKSSANNPEKMIKSVIEQLKKYSEKEIELIINELEAPVYENRLNTVKERMILNWQEVQEMGRYGISFGAHTRNHTILDQVKDINELEDELAGSKRDIEKIINNKIETLAYPNGNYSPIVISLAEKIGYKIGFTTEFGVNTKRTHKLKIKRIRIDTGSSRGENGEFSSSLFEFNIMRHILH